ncbi:hypothetical protein KIH86_24230 [Paenibacillus sp. HN-1]|uniref:hypothetical protein n=1 Tax=Paenibacillus TaxID=44249 RepID=UPI001CA820A8|nr:MULTISPECIES: hypothetical protein [Paenibacillus]MBY9078371.1 hypothetical protein [Paenibacillus sp. CGMCC 1.18879]MBY9087296.1 hypothetical protein [Paenibacillus sinensis]
MQRQQATKKFNTAVTAEMLSCVAAGMVPLYRSVATSRVFAESWTRSIVNADLDLMGELLKLCSPLAAKQGYGTNGIGYFVDFDFPLYQCVYSNGTTIPPGMVQFTFSTAVHRRIARAVFPFYRELAVNRNYAAAIALGIRRSDRKAVNRMVRSLVRTPALRTVTLEESGIAMKFKFRDSRYPYRNLLFRVIE